MIDLAKDDPNHEPPKPLALNIELAPVPIDESPALYTAPKPADAAVPLANPMA